METWIPDRMVRVTWVDSFSVASWIGRDSDVEPSPIVTVGFLIKKTKDYITVAQSVSENGNMHNVIAIPKGCISKIEDVS